MQVSTKQIMYLSVLVIAGGVAGVVYGVELVNLFPDKCIQGDCFTFLGFVGWEAFATAGLLVGGMLGALVGLIIRFLWGLMQTKTK